MRSLVHPFLFVLFQNTEESLLSDDEMDAISASDVSALSSSYFRVAKMMLIKATGTEQLNENDRSKCRERSDRLHDSGVSSSVCSLLDTIVKSSIESNHSPSEESRGTIGVSVAFDIFLRHLRICEDEATALELLDILSILATNDTELAQRAAEACWRVLHTVYTVSNRELLLPATDDDQPRKFQDTLDSLNESDLVDEVLSATIIKTATSGTKNTRANDMLRKTVLLLWSLTAQLSDLSGYGYWCKTTDELVQFLGDVDRSPLDEDTTLDGRSQRLERRGKRTHSRLHVSSIPSLSLASFDIFFELVLHAVIASFAVSPHAFTDDDVKERDSPFQHHHDMVELVGRMLDVFVSHYHLFPRRMLSVVLAACKQMLGVCIFHVEGCVQWRTAQPILTVQEKRAGVHDYGAIKYLDHLLQSFASQGAGKVLSVCQSIQRLVCPSSEKNGGNDSDDLFTNFPQNDKRFTSLMLSAQKTMDTLRDVATAHNLVAPKLDGTRIEGRQTKKAAKKVAATKDDDKGYHELAMASETHDENHSTVVIGKKKRRRVVPTLVSAQASSSGKHQEEASNALASSQTLRKRKNPVIEEDEYDWGDDKEDEEGHKMSDGFGVSGKWGGDDEGSDDESSSGSLALELSNNIFKAT